MEESLYEERGRVLFIFPYSLKIYEDRIEARLSLYTRTIPFSDIENIKLVEGFPWYFRLGPRFKTIGEEIIYFLTHHRIRSVEIEIERKSGRWKKVIYSVKEPDKFISIVKERLG